MPVHILTRETSLALAPDRLMRADVGLELLEPVVELLREFDASRRSLTNGRDTPRRVYGALVSLETIVADGSQRRIVERFSPDIPARVVLTERFKDDVGPLCECGEIAALHQAVDADCRRFVMNLGYFPDHDPIRHRTKLRTCGRCLQGLSAHRSLLLWGPDELRSCGDMVSVAIPSDWSPSNRSEIVRLHSQILPEPFGVDPVSAKERATLLAA